MMTRVFVSLKEFDVLWKSIGFGDTELRELQSFLLFFPLSGKVISGTGGLRKMRWASPGQGKSVGLRILYVDFPQLELLYFITILKKSEKENISNEEKNIISKIIASIENNLKNNKLGGKDNEKGKRKN